jgi:hypothetical protein
MLAPELRRQDGPVFHPANAMFGPHPHRIERAVFCSSVRSPPRGFLIGVRTRRRAPCCSCPLLRQRRLKRGIIARTVLSQVVHW